MILAPLLSLPPWIYGATTARNRKQVKENKTIKTKTKNKRNAKKETNKHIANKQSKTNKGACCCSVQCGSTKSKTITKTYRKQTNNQTSNKHTANKQSKTNKGSCYCSIKTNTHTKQTTCNKQTKKQTKWKKLPWANFFKVFVVHPHSRCAFLNERHTLFFFAGRCLHSSLRLIICRVLYFPPATSFAPALPSMPPALMPSEKFKICTPSGYRL